MRGFAQTPGTNYLRVRIPQIPVTDTAKLDTIPVQRQAVSIQYSDALGRSLQSVQVQGSANKKDLIMPYMYDNMGRIIKSYLPYADQSTGSSTKGTFRTNAVTNSVGFYNPASPGAPKIPTDASPFTQAVYEASPLGRLIEQGGAGADFQPGTGHAVRVGYGINGAADGVKYHTIQEGFGIANFAFAPGVLAKFVVTDGNSHRQAIWKDLQGRVVTKSQLDAPTPYYSTDYVYNDLGQLAAILPPSAKKDSTVSALQKLYVFHYDSIGRAVEKKVPGSGWVYVVYNRSDQPVLTQDSNMRAKNQWAYVKYDAEGRVVQTGMYINKTVTGRKAMQNLCDTGFPVLWETWQPGTGYTNDAFPQQSAIPGAAPLTIYTTYYFDDYSFTEASAKPFQTNIYNTAPTLRTMGMLTGTSVYVLGTSNQRLVTVYYYDGRNRPIQVQQDNHLGQVDIVNNQYNFIGELTGNQRITTAIAGNPITVRDSFVYDHAARLLDTYESFQGNAPIDISHNVYNEIDQKVSEGLHSTNYSGSTDTSYTFAQTQEFRYSIRGELTNINNGTLTNDGITQTDPNALFGESITYAETSPLGATPQYNGNISGITWRNKIEQTGMPGAATGGQGYSFTYDATDRFLQSKYYKQSGGTFVQDTTGALSERISGYDEMGNIDSLSRKDRAGNYINKLKYTYQADGNQLASISDSGSEHINGTFTYDGNGNMTSDSRKGITITYNYLDLPDTVKKGTSKLVFTYDAAGNKLYKQLISSSGTVVSQRHYIEDEELTATSSVAYDGKIESIAMAEGRIVNGGSGNYQYEYYLQDHLYTNRVTFRVDTNGALILTGVQNYYPFGRDMGDSTMNYSSSPQNQYKYEGKEQQQELSLNLYDFGARHYDPVLGRWMALDPLAEESDDLSPYNYVENNPMNLMDPDGMQPNGGNIIKDTSLGGATTNGASDLTNSSWSGANGTSSGSFGITGGLVLGSGILLQGIQAWNAFKQSVSITHWGRKFDQALSAGKDVFVGAVNAYVSDMTGANAPTSMHTSPTLYNFGRKIGHVAAIFTSAEEIEGGATLTVGGGVATPATGGASLAVSGAGLLVTTHGVFVLKNAVIGLITGSGQDHVLQSSPILQSNASDPVRSALTVRTSGRGKGLTEAGYQFQKHYDRVGAGWLKFINKNLKRDKLAWNRAGWQAFKEIWKAPGKFINTGSFYEKRLPDGRGIRFQHNWVFKGFID